MRNREENSSACSGHGALVCGQCKCYDLYAGQHCERNLDSTFSRNEDFCRQSLNTQVCSGRGTCVEGICECHMRENPKEKYTGRYCECSNFDCPYHNNRYNIREEATLRRPFCYQTFCLDVITFILCVFKFLLTCLVMVFITLS